VAGAQGPFDDLAWRAAVRVEEEPLLAEEIGRRYATGSRELPISVSDLLAPRRAYWRRRGPAAPVDEERRERMDAGRSWHARLALALPGEGAFEVRVRRSGIAGRIDLLADIPVEVKTGAGVGAEHLAEQRPEHVEQIAMYCALTGSSAGRIVTLTPGAEGTVAAEAVDVSVPVPAAVDAEMRRRAAAIRTALREGQPAALPACRWFGRRCEFEAAKLCDCSGAEPAPSGEILEQVARFTARPEIEGRWSSALSRAPTEERAAAAGRFRDLLYPRRAYFERVAAPGAPGPAVPVPAPPTEATVYERLVGAVEGGPVGEVAQLPPRAPGPEEEVPGFRGLPYLLRTSRAWSRVRPADLVARFPQYAVELGFRCATTGTGEGRVFLAFERAERESDRFEVLRIRFDPIALFRTIGTGRAALLRAAIDAREPGRLPPCPGWMAEGCPYGATCGCADDPGRSQR